MQFRIILSCLLLGSITCVGQDLSSLTPPDSTLFYVDSVETVPSTAGLNPDRIAFINVVRFKKVPDKYMARGISNIIYIETKPFAHARYNRMFSEISPAYAEALKKYGSDSSFQYILDGAVLTNNVESSLAALEKKGIADISVISPKILKKQYKVKGMKVGVVIRSK
ncbi:hypothetical protein SAMN05428988_4882 [Chitinophaga sp. YR573]|uniref:hypothetical protein n=1 Tax=Chitinophaga sp. YR573 TaxID=1881040 RepID=UPI0008CF3D4F|nr:hypothetical protein [Chitinophaga sp. YR573]SEW38654.1 hypothetical protein SAMN05428988_4882 [Chitinophaga sp. YR573]